MPHESPSSNKTLTDNKPHKKLITSKSSQTMTGPQAPGRRHGLLGCFFLLLGVSALGVSAASGAPWTPKTFPNPTVDLEACGRGGIRSWICDPDMLLTREGQNVVEGVIKLIAAGEAPYAKAPCGGDGNQGYEVAVAVMKAFKTEWGDDEKTAEVFAQSLHQSWGVGRAACQNGVLLLLSIQNRQLYISTGEGTKHMLTWEQLGNIIDEAKPFLRDRKYDDAVQHAVVNIGLALAGKPIEGESSDGWWTATVLLLFFSLFGFAVWSGVKENMRANKRYRECRTLLDRIKRDQASLSSGAYTVTSCPICLEEFETPPASSAAAAGSDAQDAGPSESATEKTPLLGGHASGSKGVGLGSTAGGTGSASTAGGVPAPEPAAPSAPSAPGSAAGPAEPPRTPLTLPCGHIFCEACISRWLDQRKTSCPICRRDIDSGQDAPPPPPHPRPCGEHQAQWEQEFPEPVLPQVPGVRYPTVNAPPVWRTRFNTASWRWRPHPRGYTVEDMQRRGAVNEQQALDLLRQDLMFRLMALNRRYPQYVTPEMARAWGQDVYHGRDLSATQLRNFQLNDPQVKRQLASGGSSGASSSFGGGGGGGRSAGGRGGSW